MDALLRELQTILHRDAGLAATEWQRIEPILRQAKTQQVDLLRWIFVQSHAYTETRARAGILLIAAAPHVGWTLLRQLLSSPNPDDRAAAITVLEHVDDPHKRELLKPLLDDPWPYIQFEAVDMLLDSHPTEVRAVLEQLMQHKEAWVRTASTERLRRLEHQHEFGQR